MRIPLLVFSPRRALIAVTASAAAAQSASAQPSAQPQAAQTQAARPGPASPAAAGPRPVSRAQFIADMDTEFRKMDADRNGIVTKTEIEQFERATLAARQQARRRALFAELDVNRDGQLSMEEFSRLPMAAPPSQAGAMIGRFDLNRDQQIGQVEYRTVTLQNFDRLDTDKDGVVSPAEMRAAGIGPGAQVAGTRR
ncbi:MAG TPA: EF-hand domain-containing protein [Sphingomicrobium sp.]|nr:EF-hand domain-containing protein [Sphingomicrobium sp.]